MALQHSATGKDGASGKIAKALLERALAPIKEDMGEFASRLPNYLSAETKSAKEIIDHVFGAGGKRIRPALYFFCCKLLGYKGAHYYEMAAVTEFVHTASLLHDDVVDNSTLRRNKPTANSIWGDETSVLVGDLIYSTASEMMAATGNLEIVKTFASAIRKMSEGELYQLEHLFNSNTSEEHYLSIIECKTAILIEASCKCAALLVNASEEQKNALAKFGRYVGTAFQLIDDALDYLSKQEVFGKPTLADLPEGKVTLPVILLKTKCDKAELNWLESIFTQNSITKDDVKTVANLVKKYETAKLTIDRAGQYTRDAMEALKVFPKSSARDDLENLASKLLGRFS